MRNQIEFIYDTNQPKELYYSAQNYDELDINVLLMEEPSSSRNELEQLFLEAQEYDFLTGKTSQVLPDNMQEEEE